MTSIICMHFRFDPIYVHGSSGIYKCYRYSASRMDLFEEYRSSSRTYTTGSRQSKRYITTKIAKAGPKNGSSDKRCLGGLPGHKMPLRSAYINMVRLKSWACLFSISILRFSVTLFPYQFAGQLRFLLPVPCLPGSQWNWRFLRNNLKKQSIPFIFAETAVKLHRDLPCIGPFSFPKAIPESSKCMEVFAHLGFRQNFQISLLKTAFGGIPSL